MPTLRDDDNAKTNNFATPHSHSQNKINTIEIKIFDYVKHQLSFDKLATKAKVFIRFRTLALQCDHMLKEKNDLNIAISEKIARQMQSKLSNIRNIYRISSNWQVATKTKLC